MLLTPALGTQRQVDIWESQDSQGYIVKPCLIERKGKGINGIRAVVLS